jgi:hypothetical protein
MSRRRLKAVTPPPTDAESWKRLMNFLFICEQDGLFEWLRDSVRPAVEEGKKRAA